jgi:hypothetical protein
LLASLKVLDANGTTLSGRPVITGCPQGTFLLVSAGHLTYGRSDDVRVTVSTAGTVELDTAPVGDVIAPTAAASSTISLFQEDGIALKAAMDLDWHIGGGTVGFPEQNAAVVALTGATFA